MPASEEMEEVEVDCELADIGDELCDTTRIMEVIATIDDRIETPPRRKADVCSWTDEHSSRLRHAIEMYGTADWAKVGALVGFPDRECRRQWLLLEQARHRSSMPDYFVAKRKKTKPPPDRSQTFRTRKPTTWRPRS